jgi:hypothetical protein
VIYRAIPFVFELRTLLDWMCTRTALDVWEWFKLEEIYAALYCVQCYVIYWKAHPRGGAIGVRSFVLSFLNEPPSSDRLLNFSFSFSLTERSKGFQRPAHLLLAGARHLWSAFAFLFGQSGHILEQRRLCSAPTFDLRVRVHSLAHRPIVRSDVCF